MCIELAYEMKEFEEDLASLPKQDNQSTFLNHDLKSIFLKNLDPLGNKSLGDKRADDHVGYLRFGKRG